MSPRLTPERRAILVAMASRNKPLIKGARRWFVPEWRGPMLEAQDIEALIAGGHLVHGSGPLGHRLLRLTDSGRAAATMSREAAE